MTAVPRLVAGGPPHGGGEPPEVRIEAMIDERRLVVPRGVDRPRGLGVGGPGGYRNRRMVDDSAVRPGFGATA